jgi:hypothetical protein
MKNIFFFFFLLLAQWAFAQEQSRVVVVLTNGNEYIGTISKDDGREIYLMTEGKGGMY